MDSRSLSSVFSEFAPTDSAAVFANIMTSLPKDALAVAPTFKLHVPATKRQQQDSASHMLSLAESMLDGGETRQQFFQLPTRKDTNTMRTVELDVSIPTSYACDEDFSCGSPEDVCSDLGELLSGGNSSALGGKRKSKEVLARKVEEKVAEAVLEVAAQEDAKDAVEEKAAEAPAAKRPMTYMEMIAPVALLEAERNRGVAPVRYPVDANEQRLALKKLKRREQNREAQRRHRMRAKNSGKEGDEP
mmetsp:Transcript_54798/g.129235  ORF Transcript_54798/g.129235 Transcript_54798/m.129235 type:complete len:246 (+) Transcript_54798:54-791(+)